MSTAAPVATDVSRDDEAASLTEEKANRLKRETALLSDNVDKLIELCQTTGQCAAVAEPAVVGIPPLPRVGPPAVTTTPSMTLPVSTIRQLALPTTTKTPEPHHRQEAEEGDSVQFHPNPFRSFRGVPQYFTLGKKNTTTRR